MTLDLKTKPAPERIKLIMGANGLRIWWWDAEPLDPPEGEIIEYVQAASAPSPAATGSEGVAYRHPMLGSNVTVRPSCCWYSDWQGAILTVTAVHLEPGGRVSVTTAESDGLSQYGKWRNTTDGWAVEDLEPVTPAPAVPDDAAVRALDLPADRVTDESLNRILQSAVSLLRHSPDKYRVVGLRGMEPPAVGICGTEQIISMMRELRALRTLVPMVPEAALRDGGKSDGS